MLARVVNRAAVCLARDTATAPFNEVTAILNPRVVRAGVRFAF
jgi:hypothetical protein